MPSTKKSKKSSNVSPYPRPEENEKVEKMIDEQAAGMDKPDMCSASGKCQQKGCPQCFPKKDVCEDHTSGLNTEQQLNDNSM